MAWEYENLLNPRSIENLLKMLCLLFAFSFIFLFSCRDKRTSNYYAFQTLNETLLSSNKTIRSSTETISKSLEDKLSDPTTNAKAALWYAKSENIHRLAFSLYNFIDSIKTNIKNTAGLRHEGDREMFEEDNKSAVRQTMKQKGKELYEKLISLKDSFFAVDKIIEHEFDQLLFILPPAYDENGSMQQEFLKNFFDDLPAIGALAVLSKFQNGICTAENKIFSLIHTQVAYDPIHYWPWPIITQSSSILKGGEDLKIVAGIGEFMTNNKFEIIVNGKKISVNDIGVAEYTFKTSQAAGTYKIPIKLTYSDQDANTRTIERIITYSVKTE